MKKTTEIGLTLGMVAVAAMLVVGRQGKVAPRLAPGLTASFASGQPLMASDLPRADTLAEWLRLGHHLGPDQPMVRIIEFGNFTCGFCLEFAAAIDTVQRKYPGLVGVTWLHFVFDSQLVRPNATTFLANASECIAHEGEFEAFYRALMVEGKSFASRRGVVQWAGNHGGVDTHTLDACLEVQGGMPRVMAHARYGIASGTYATPTWYLNKKRFVGAVRTHVLDSLVRAEMRRANEAG
ncbi:MAG: thioredoxin domain-containing protein [Gemmatimonadetes bacterium]|nr:thioredoxin domain-containing protein [Gemmatimonadota bacterium]